MMHICILSIWEAKQQNQQFTQGHPWLHKEFEVSLEYVRREWGDEND